MMDGHLLSPMQDCGIAGFIKEYHYHYHYLLIKRDLLKQRHAKITERLERFQVLAKCTSKFDCLIHEMLFIRKLKPELNVQTDSIRAKVFV